MSAILSRTPPVWRPFPVEVLPSDISRFAIRAAEAMHTDPAMIACPALTAAASAIGATRTAHPGGTWREPSILWMMLSAPSGSMKSPCISLALKPLEAAQSAAFHRHATAMIDFEREQTLYESRFAEWKKTGSRKGDDPPEAPKRPICERFLFSDTTCESAAELLEENPRGLLLHRDELAAFVKSSNQYKGGKGADIENWMAAHRAEPWIVDRRTTKFRHVPRAVVSVLGGIQPEIAERLFSGELTENGLFGRFLIVAPPQRPKVWTNTSIPNAVEAGYTDMIHRLLALDFSAQGEPIELTLADDAHPRFKRFVDSLNAEIADLTGSLRSAMSKLEAAFVRFAMIIELASDPRSTTMSAPSLEAAETLTRWFAGETQRMYCRFRETDEQRQTREMIELIQSNEGRITTRELERRRPRLYPHHDQSWAALNALVTQGIGRWDVIPPGPRGGPSKMEFVLVSANQNDKCPENPEKNDDLPVSVASGDRKSNPSFEGQEDEEPVMF